MELDSHRVALVLINHEYFVNNISQFARELGVKRSLRSNETYYDFSLQILEEWKGKVGNHEAIYQTLVNILRNLEFTSAAGKHKFMAEIKILRMIKCQIILLSW